MNVEILLCIDCTGSMGNTISSVKENVSLFIDAVQEKFPKEKYNVKSYKLRVVEFRDIYADEDRSIVGSKFFNIEREYDELINYINSLEANGGIENDLEEDGLEGLAYGLITTNWTFSPHDLQIIGLWTDISAHSLEKNQKRNLTYYPDGMPKTFKEFTNFWNNKFLRKAPNASIVIFAPNKYPWKNINITWANSHHITSVTSKTTGALQDIFRIFHQII